MSCNVTCFVADGEGFESGASGTSSAVIVAEIAGRPFLSSSETDDLDVTRDGGAFFRIDFGAGFFSESTVGDFWSALEVAFDANCFGSSGEDLSSGEGVWPKVVAALRDTGVAAGAAAVDANTVDFALCVLMVDAEAKDGDVLLIRGT